MKIVILMFLLLLALTLTSGCHAVIYPVFDPVPIIIDDNPPPVPHHHRW